MFYYKVFFLVLILGIGSVSCVHFAQADTIQINGNAYAEDGSYGTVTSEPSGIKCYSDGEDILMGTCGMSFERNSIKKVYLRATPRSDSKFTGWQAGTACSGTDSLCTIDLTKVPLTDDAISTTALFELSGTGKCSDDATYKRSCKSSCTSPLESYSAGDVDCKAATPSTPFCCQEKKDPGSGGLTCPTGFSPYAGACFPDTDKVGLSDLTVKDIVINFMKWVLYLFGFLAIIAFVISGIQYLTATGNMNQIETAKRNMIYSIVGVVVALAALVIIITIDALLRGATWLEMMEIV